MIAVTLTATEAVRLATQCPSAGDLVLAALAGEGSPVDERTARHERECSSCRRELAGLREVVGVLRSRVPEPATPEACLDEGALARLAEGVVPDRDRGEIAHLLSCARCREAFADANRLLHDPLIAAELDRLATPSPQRQRRWKPVAYAGTLAAAALAGLVLWPAVARQPELARPPATDALRERTITTTAAPQIVSPPEMASPADSLRWTSVPRADLYRLTFWRADGTVVWQGEVRDTVHPLPRQLTESGDRVLLWDVRARTGWDRWVRSDLAELTLRLPE